MLVVVSLFCFYNAIQPGSYLGQLPWSSWCMCNTGSISITRVMPLSIGARVPISDSTHEPKQCNSMGPKSWTLSSSNCGCHTLWVKQILWTQIRLCHKMRQFLIKSVLLMLSNAYLADMVLIASGVQVLWEIASSYGKVIFGPTYTVTRGTEDMIQRIMNRLAVYS